MKKKQDPHQNRYLNNTLPKNKSWNGGHRLMAPAITRESNEVLVFNKKYAGLSPTWALF